MVPLARDTNGKRRQHRFTFVGTKKEAEKAFIAGVAAIDNGTFVTPDRATFGEYLTDWLASAKTQFAGKTWERYEQMTRLHVKPTLGNIRLQSITSSQLSKAYAEWRATGLSGQTVIHHHRLIHRVLAQALREGRVRQNVAALATRPKATRKEMRFLNVDEIGVWSRRLAERRSRRRSRLRFRPARDAANCPHAAAHLRFAAPLPRGSPLFRS